MQFLLSAIGSAGDVHPFIAIGQALHARGHAVRIAAMPPFEDRIRAAGLEFTALGTQADYQRLVERAELWHPRRGARLIFDELLARLPQAHATIAALATPDTILVGSTLSWGMRLVQEQTGLAAATVHLSPTCIQSAIAPAVLPGIGDLGRLPTWSTRLLQSAAERWVLDPWLAPRLNRVRAELGLAPVRQIVSRWMHSPDLVIAAWPGWFAPRQPDLPPHSLTTGFARFAEPMTELDSSLESFLQAGEAPIGITPGSAMAHGDAFIASAVDACSARGRRAVLVTPYDTIVPRDLPGTVHRIGYAPFARLLPRLSALIHHGGIGSSAQALAAGLPQLVVPFAHDQFDNAKRLEREAGAIRLEQGATHEVWVRAIDALTSERSRAAARRAAERSVTDGDASEKIGALLEGLASQARQTHPPRKVR
ncbi:glycosyltransferase [soil metagenome]